MLIPGERRLPGILVLVALIGWGLAALFWWQGREPAETPSARDQETVQTLEDEGFDEVTVSHRPSLTIAAPGPKAAPLVAHATGALPFTEAAPPEVGGLAFDSSTFEGPHEDHGEVVITSHSLVPNWALRPGDLGLKSWDFTIRRVKRRAFVQFLGVIQAQTPAGVVERDFVMDPEGERAWVASSALPGGRYVDFEAGVNTGTTADFVVNWGTGGRMGWGVGPAYDFDRRRWQVAVRMRFGRIRS